MYTAKHKRTGQVWFGQITTLDEQPATLDQVKTLMRDLEWEEDAAQKDPDPSGLYWLIDLPAYAEEELQGNGLFVREYGGLRLHIYCD